MIFAGLAWLVFVPGAVFAARFRNDVSGPPGTWMKIHKKVNTFASVLMAGGVATIVYWKVDRSLGLYSGTAHGNYGIAALVLLIMQMTGGFYRPGKVKQESPKLKKVVRCSWEIGHRVIAVGSFLVACIAVFEGFPVAKTFGMVGTDEMFVGCAIWLCVLAGIWLLRELFRPVEIQSNKGSATLTGENLAYDNPAYEAAPTRGGGLFADITGGGGGGNQRGC